MRFPGWQALAGQKKLKYISLINAIRYSTPFISNLFKNEMPTDTSYKYIICDVKIINLKEGQIPCLPYWHYDCVMDINNSAREELNYLWEFGAECYTEFINGPTEFDKPARFQDEISKLAESKGFLYKPEYIHEYGRVLHRPTKARKAGKRILVRKTHTDVIRPLPFRG